MSTFVLIHGAGDVGWSWHLVEAELRRRGHDVVAPDLPADDTLTLEDYAAAVVTVVGHSFGGFTASLVAARLPVDALVFVAGMVPAPARRPATGGRTPATQRPSRNRPRATAGRPATTTRTSASTTTCRANWPPGR